MGAFDYLKWTYDGAFEQLFGLGRGEFEQKFFKNSNARGDCPGGMLKLRFDWYITTVLVPSAGRSHKAKKLCIADKAKRKPLKKNKGRCHGHEQQDQLTTQTRVQHI